MVVLVSVLLIYTDIGFSNSTESEPPTEFLYCIDQQIRDGRIRSPM